MIGRVDFGKGYFLYSYPDYIAFGGEVLIPAPGVVITAGVDGELGVSSGLYSLHGSAEACVAGGISSIGCVGGEAWVTSKGFVVCGDIAGEFHPGVGYHWGDTFPEIWLGIPGDGCKPSGYWLDTAIKPARGAQAGGARTFRVAAGVKAVRVRIIGSGGAPDVTVKGPDGETVSTASAEYVKGKRIAALRHLPGGVTWLGIRAQPGEYTITPNAGSPAIRSVATSEPARASEDHRLGDDERRAPHAQLPDRRARPWRAGHLLRARSDDVPQARDDDEARRGDRLHAGRHRIRAPYHRAHRGPRHARR